MTKAEAVAMCDASRSALLHPGEMLGWVWLRVIINAIPDDQWDAAVMRATEILSR